MPWGQRKRKKKESDFMLVLLFLCVCVSVCAQCGGAEQVGSQAHGWHACKLWSSLTMSFWGGGMLT